ncbi:class F sortase [Streptomyces sp. NPDC004549]|uniref:class F sortase n=1 Tax=Streptomyces sp. NPDC004549 TaxID=3154283 RepID=UPI00339F3BAD
MAADPSPHRADEQAARGGRLTLWSVAIVVLVLSVLGGHHGTGTVPGAARAAGTTAATGPAGPALPRSAPTRLIIPKIGVNAPFTALVLGSDGRLEPPPADNTNLVGWYSKGVSPGEKGTSVIAGHVDTKTSAAVFAGLEALLPGDHFTVERADGRTAKFVVDSAETFEKDDFPSDRVYDNASRPEARLITCAGDYDHTAKDYKENLVVFAHLV